MVDPETIALRRISESYRRWSESRARYLNAEDAVQVAEDARIDAYRAFRRAERDLHKLIEALTAGSPRP